MYDAWNVEGSCINLLKICDLHAAIFGHKFSFWRHECHVSIISKQMHNSLYILNISKCKKIL